jgi:hypothetical protein
MAKSTEKKKKEVNLRPKKVDSSIIEVPTNAPGKKSWSGGTRAEIEERGAFPQTIVRVEEAAKMISDGVGRGEVIEHLKTKYNMTYNTAQKYFVSACHYLIPDNDEFKSGLIKQNFERLEKIVNDSLKEGDKKMAKDAIAEMNKMLGLGTNSVKITNDPKNNTNEITISFGG